MTGWQYEIRRARPFGWRIHVFKPPQPSPGRVIGMAAGIGWPGCAGTDPWAPTKQLAHRLGRRWIRNR